MIDHLGFPVADLDRSAAFYLAVLAPLGLREITRFPIPGGTLAGFGGADGKPFFWLSAGESASFAGGVRSELHLAFAAADVDAVDGVHRAAEEFGAEVLHAARHWPEYHPGYYAVFLRDPDGHNVEAVTHAAPPDGS